MQGKGKAGGKVKQDKDINSTPTKKIKTQESDMEFTQTTVS